MLFCLMLRWLEAGMLPTWASLLVPTAAAGP